MGKLYPIFLDISQRTCLIIGGGQVARRKVESLLEHEAKVIVVSPGADQLIEKWAEGKRIIYKNREFLEEDLNEVDITFITTDNPILNSSISKLCRKKGILVNAVDDPTNCDFFVPSVVRRNSLILAISTEGKSPMFAKKMRQQLEHIISPEYGEFVDLLGEYREWLKENVRSIEDRKMLWERIIYSDIFDLFMVGEKEKARERINKCMSSWLD